MPETGKISIVIPNYNGEQLLEQNLPSIIAALTHWGGQYELIVVDDCSIDFSCKLIAERFPQVRLIGNSSNLGFSKTCNIGFNKASYPVGICINNDVNVEVDFIAPLLKCFRDKNVFAVTPNILAERKMKNQGIIVGLYGKGFLKGCCGSLDSVSRGRENLYALGACVAYDMEKFRALGGYCEMYSPYLFEDVDISYRAWKRGWSSIYEPGATVYHYANATIGKTKKRLKRVIYFRNRFLFHWSNLTDTSFLLKNIFYTFVRLSISFLWFDFAYYSSFFGALCRFGQVIDMRKSAAIYQRLSDREILQRTSKPSA
jgi:GT2 family glycosyltransferase